MTDIEIPAVPAKLSEFDWWELEAFWQKTRTEGWAYSLEHYHPAFEFTDRWPVPSTVVRDLMNQYRPEFHRRWDADGETACAAHNNHVEESRNWWHGKLVERRNVALWGVQFRTGVVLRCPTGQWARWVFGGSIGYATGLVQPGSFGLSEDAASWTPAVSV